MKIVAKTKIKANSQPDILTQPLLSPAELAVLLNQIEELYGYDINVTQDENGAVLLTIGGSMYEILVNA